MKPRGSSVGDRQIAFLLVAIFIAGIGLGITLPVLPFYAERLMGTQNLSRTTMPLHVTGLTSIYALMQFAFAPLWGAWSDKVGRKRLICIGIAGTAASQVLFGLSTTLPLLYGARILGGILSGSLIPAATAYFADLSNDDNRTTRMAWLGTVSSLGTVAGLAFGGATSTVDFHYRSEFWHFRVDAFSMPFFAASFLMAFTTIAVWLWLPDSERQDSVAHEHSDGSWRILFSSLSGLLALAMASQVALTAFEATFPLFAQEKFGFGPKQIGLTFMVCGLVMAIFQVIAVTYAHRIHAATQLVAGFVLMGIGILLLLAARELAPILVVVGAIALGMAFIAPNLSSLSARGRGNRTGAAVGLLSASNSLGQVGGPLIGGALFAWRIELPYSISGGLMIALAVTVILKKVKLAPAR